MVWLATSELPQSSVAVQVRVIEKRCVQTPAIVSATKTMSTIRSQSSLAVGIAGIGTASHSTVASAGTPANVGALVSNIENREVVVEGLSQGSVTVKVTSTNQSQSLATTVG